MTPKNHATAVTLPDSVLIDPRAEPLNVILTPYRGITHVPNELNGTALMVFIELNKCFKKANRVAEGLLPNVIWGFEQCGFDPKFVASGLAALRAQKYIFYSDASRLPIIEYGFDPKWPVWVRYDRKFLNLLVKNSSDGILFTGEASGCASSI